MKFIFYLMAMLIISPVLSAQTYQQVRVHTSRENITAIASLGLAADDGIYRNGIWETVICAEEVAKLRNAGFTIDIINYRF